MKFSTSVLCLDFYHQRTPLHLAAEEGHADIVRYLADKGLDISITDDYLVIMKLCTYSNFYKKEKKSFKCKEMYVAMACHKVHNKEE